MNIFNPYRYEKSLIPISYWSFDNDDLTDSVGNNDGTDTGVSSIVFSSATPPLTGKAASFSTGREMTVADADNLSFGDGTTDNPFSISMWITENTANTIQFYLNKRNSANLEYQIIYSSGAYGFYIGDNDASNRLQKLWSRSKFTSQFHLCAVYDGNKNLSLYLNGVEGGVQSEVGTYNAMHNTTADLLIGGARWTGNNNFSTSGRIDEVKIFDIELTSQQVLDIYNNIL